MRLVVPKNIGAQPKRPGIRGGKFYIDAKGEIRYGTRPSGKAKILEPHPDHHYGKIIDKIGQHGEQRLPIAEKAALLGVSQERLLHAAAHAHAHDRRSVTVHTYPSGKVRAVHFDWCRLAKVPDSEEGYIKEFLVFAKRLPKLFDGVVKPKIASVADAALILRLGDTKIRRYDLFPAGAVEFELRGDSPRIFYSMSAENTDHGSQLLAHLYAHHMACPYTLLTSATTVSWTDGVPHDHSYVYTKKGVRTYGRCAAYSIVFSPGDRHHAGKIIKEIQESAGAQRESDRMIPGSNDLPHMWWAGAESAESVSGFANTMKVGHRTDMTVLSKRDLTDYGYKARPVHIGIGLPGVT